MPTMTPTLPVGRCDRHVHERFALSKFLPRLAAVNTRDDALALLADRPDPGSPARPLYDRLGVFLTLLEPPAGVWEGELDAYVGLVERFVLSGSMPYGEGAGALVAIARTRDLFFTVENPGVEGTPGRPTFA